MLVAHCRRAVGIVPGACFSSIGCSSEDYPKWRRWGRPKKVTLRSGSSKLSFNLVDRHVFPFVLSENMQILELSSPVTSDQLEITVDDVYRGGIDEVAITELVFFKAP